jgi:plastocyanin
MRRIVIAGIAALALALAPTAHAASAPLVYVTGPESATVGWYLPAFAVPQGSGLTFVNVDIAQHDFVAECDASHPEGCGADNNPWCFDSVTGKDLYPTPGTCPIFRSILTGIGKTTVFGVESAPPGVYTFRCSIHDVMVGTLFVGVPSQP